MEQVTLTPEQQRCVDELNLEMAEIRVRLAESEDSLWDAGPGPGHLEQTKKELEEARQRVARWHDVIDKTSATT